MSGVTEKFLEEHGIDLEEYSRQVQNFIVSNIIGNTINGTLISNVAGRDVSNNQREQPENRIGRDLMRRMSSTAVTMHEYSGAARIVTSTIKGNRIDRGANVKVSVAGRDVNISSGGGQEQWITQLIEQVEKARRLLATRADGPSASPEESTALAEAYEAVEEMEGVAADPERHRLLIKKMAVVLKSSAEFIAGLASIADAILVICRAHL